MYTRATAGVEILDATTGRGVGRIPSGSSPLVVGRSPTGSSTRTSQVRIAFGDPRGYFVKSWAAGKLADTIGTIQTSTDLKERCRTTRRPAHLRST